MKKVTVIIPCRNEEKYIRNCLVSILNMDYPSNLVEILVVDGMSSDNTLAIVKELQLKFPNIKFLLNHYIYTPQGLNIGIRNATSDYLMIASAHAVFDRNYLSELISNLTSLNCDVVGGIVKTTVLNKTNKSTSIVKVLSNKFGVGNSIFRIGAEKPVQVDTVPFGVYHKNIFQTVGLYNERLTRNQDMEFSKRIITHKKNIFLIPNAISNYFARENFSKLAENAFGNGIWIPRTVYITKKISSLSFRHFVPLIFILSLIIPVLLTVLFKSAFLISIIILSLYFTIILSESLKINESGTNLLYILWSFIVLHFSYGFGSLVGIFDLKNCLKGSDNVG